VAVQVREGARRARDVGPRTSDRAAGAARRGRPRHNVDALLGLGEAHVPHDVLVRGHGLEDVHLLQDAFPLLAPRDALTATSSP
jgi:hypothetical protein